MLKILDSPGQELTNHSRRTILQAGGAGLLGLTLPRLLAAEEVGDSSRARAKSVIFLFLFGGPSQLETFDLKPEAPETIRGPFQPIASRTPGLLIGEHLPLTAQVTDKCCVVRTMTHNYNDHSGGGHYIQTGHRWPIPVGGGFNATPADWPSMGSVVGYQSHYQEVGQDQELPAYVVLTNFLGRLQEYSSQLRRPGEYAGWLGRGYDPITTAIDKRGSKDNPYWREMTDQELTFQIQGLANHPELTLNRLERRRSLLEQFDTQLKVAERGREVTSYNRFQERAFSLVASAQTQEALDITRESAELRDRYGRHLFGQSTLMARRLIEAGVRFATVHYDCVDGYSWDSHRNSDDVKRNLLPTFDQAFSALITDLDERGLLDETLVVAMGEMGRTPKADSNWGRNHWSTLFPAVLAGAGIRGGSLFGSSDKHAAYPATNPVRPEELAATIYHALGIDPELRLPDAQGRAVSIVEEGKPVLDVFE